MTQYYKEKLEQGQYYQDMVIEKLYNLGLPIISYSSKQFQSFIGENKSGIEIKNDERFAETKNFYIEIAEKSNPKNPNFIKSGIYRNDNTWLYIIGNMKNFYVFSKKQLITAAEQKNKDGSYKYKRVQTSTSQGMLLPFETAIKYYCILEVEFNENDFIKLKEQIQKK